MLENDRKNEFVGAVMSRWERIAYANPPPTERSAHGWCALPLPPPDVEPLTVTSDGFIQSGCLLSKSKDKQVRPTQLYIFGGVDTRGDLLGDLQVFDLPTCTWATPMVKGRPPSPRCGHTMVGLADRFVVVIGGWGSRPHKDIHVFDTGAIACVEDRSPPSPAHTTWYPVRLPKDPPVPLFDRCAATWNQKILLFVGHVDKQTNIVSYELGGSWTMDAYCL